MASNHSFYKRLAGVAVATVLILMVPLVAMQFSDQVNWSSSDFVIMGCLLFATGSLMLWTLSQSNITAYRLAMAIGIGATFLLIWTNLAVGLIGSGPNPGNLMYIGVVATVAIGLIVSRFRAGSLEIVMFLCAFLIVLITSIALMAGMSEYPGSSIGEIIGVNVFYVILFMAAGLLFRNAETTSRAH